MTRNVLIASAVILLAALLLYFVVFPPKPRNSQLAELVDAAETLCLSSGTSTATATLKSRLDAVKGLNATASAGTGTEVTRGALTSLSESLQVDQNDKIRACMQPFVDKMLATAR